MQMCIIYELAPEAASDKARLNLDGNSEAEECCGHRRPAAVRNARRLTILVPQLLNQFDQTFERLMTHDC